jgi:cyclopropane fatty-acyl-phospholipid synthase-like methyltransferase
VLSRRDGGDARTGQRTAGVLAVYRDGVLERAGIAEGDTVLDVGTGAGLIAFGALAPTLEEAVAQALTEEERERFERHVRAALADGAPVRKTLATVYLRAVRP